MEEKNELNDIILNKGGSSANSKKIILAVATLGVILIIVVMLMNTLTSNGTDNLPQAMLPPEPQTKEIQEPMEEPLFEEVEVIQEPQQNNDALDQIAKKLKEESQKEKIKPVVEAVVKPVVKPIVKPVKEKVVTPTPTPVKTSATGSYYIQVGSFAKYKPNKKFLDSINKLGYTHKFHEVTRNGKTLNKVLVGPFNTEKNARKALIPIRSSIEPGAFLLKL